MMEFYVSGQSLKIYTPAVAADSLNYLTAKVNFTDADWAGASKWLHFRCGQLVYDIELDENDCITADKHLNLTVGLWEIYLTGTVGETRLTSLPVMLRVYASGLIDAPLHELPLSVAEQVDFNARQALLLAQSVKDSADSGKFDGRDGTSLSPLGHFATAEELAAIITQPKPGDVYSVGDEPPYSIFVWDGVNLIWRDHGVIQGVPGEMGEKGATFIPNLDSGGNLSWFNDGGLSNPATVNIMGPKGEKGDKGDDGKSPYQIAGDNGYTGTEASFNAALTAFPYHNSRHLPEGADPILVQSGNIADAAVTRAKLASSARTLSFENMTLESEVWAEDSSCEGYAYRAAISCEGVTARHFPIVVFSPEDAFSGGFAPVARSDEGIVYIYARNKIAQTLTIPSIVCLPLG